MAGAFDEVRILGVLGSPRVQELELRRLQRVRALARLDPWCFRQRLPEALTVRLQAALRRLLSGPAISAERSEEGARAFGVGDFALVETTAEELDLVAICRK